jgi:hypothetical protein
MELLLPFYIKIFPKMMPTPFQDLSEEVSEIIYINKKILNFKEQKNYAKMKAKIATAKFLQDALEEIAMTRKSRSKGDETTSRAYEFTQFLKQVSNKSILFVL